MEKEKEPADGMRVIETEAKQEWTDRHSLDGERQCCVKVGSPADMCPPLPLGLILPTYSYN